MNTNTGAWKATLARIIDLLNGFIQFGRPHTIIGTVLAIVALYSVHAPLNSISNMVDVSLFAIILVAFASNYYIVGLNQITDVMIDEINKPYLPLPSQMLTMLEAKVITVSSGLFALMYSWMLGIFLGITITMSLVIGTLYSLGPVRLKQRFLWGSVSIIVVRSLLINIGISIHLLTVFQFQLSQLFNQQFNYLLLMVLGITVVISISKDIPDKIGDMSFNVDNVVTRIGTEKVFHFSKILIYIVQIIGIGYSIVVWNSIFLAFFHILVFLVFLYKTHKADISVTSHMVEIYKLYWYNYYLVHILIILIESLTLIGFRVI